MDSSGVGRTFWDSGRTNYLSSPNAVVIQSGSNITVNSGSALYMDGSLNIRSGTLSINNATGGSLTMNSEVGLGAASYSQAPIRIYCNGTGARPGIAFWHGGLGYACMLYYENNSKFRFVDTGGAVHEITSS
jgi:hypothetical protein